MNMQYFAAHSRLTFIYLFFDKNIAKTSLVINSGFGVETAPYSK